eukprot:Nk52_evm32s317 gene=Nk52_evmTU32s317
MMNNFQSSFQLDQRVQPLTDASCSMGMGAGGVIQSATGQQGGESIAKNDHSTIPIRKNSSNPSISHIPPPSSVSSSPTSSSVSCSSAPASRTSSCSTASRSSSSSINTTSASSTHHIMNGSISSCTSIDIDDNNHSSSNKDSNTRNSNNNISSTASHSVTSHPSSSPPSASSLSCGPSSISSTNNNSAGTPATASQRMGGKNSHHIGDDMAAAMGEVGGEECYLERGNTVHLLEEAKGAAGAGINTTAAVSVIPRRGARSATIGGGSFVGTPNCGAISPSSVGASSGGGSSKKLSRSVTVAGEFSAPVASRPPADSCCSTDSQQQSPMISHHLNNPFNLAPLELDIIGGPTGAGPLPPFGSFAGSPNRSPAAGGGFLFPSTVSSPRGSDYTSPFGTPPGAEGIDSSHPFFYHVPASQSPQHVSSIQQQTTATATQGKKPVRARANTLKSPRKLPSSTVSAAQITASSSSACTMGGHVPSSPTKSLPVPLSPTHHPYLNSSHRRQSSASASCASASSSSGATGGVNNRPRSASSSVALSAIRQQQEQLKMQVQMQRQEQAVPVNGNQGNEVLFGTAAGAHCLEGGGDENNHSSDSGHDNMNEDGVEGKGQKMTGERKRCTSTSSNTSRNSCKRRSPSPSSLDQDEVDFLKESSAAGKGSQNGEEKEGADSASGVGEDDHTTSYQHGRKQRNKIAARTYRRRRRHRLIELEAENEQLRVRLRDMQDRILRMNLSPSFDHQSHHHISSPVVGLGPHNTAPMQGPLSMTQFHPGTATPSPGGTTPSSVPSHRHNTHPLGLNTDAISLGMKHNEEGASVGGDPRRSSSFGEEGSIVVVPPMGAPERRYTLEQHQASPQQFVHSDYGEHHQQGIKQDQRNSCEFERGLLPETFFSEDFAIIPGELY